jgi:tetratricopeptide (TPR) repeat protein
MAAIILFNSSAIAQDKAAVPDLSPPVVALLGQLRPLLQAGNLVKANQLLSHYQISKPGGEDFYLGVANAYGQYKFSKQANDLITAGLKKYPRSFALHYRCADYWITVSELDLAEPELRSCLQISPRSAAGHALMARLLNDRLNFDAGLKEAEMAIALGPADSSMYLAKSNSLRNMDRTEEAVDALDHAVTLSNHVDYNLRHMRAELLQRLGRNQAAISDCLYLAKVDPSHANWAYDRIGACYLAMKKPADALKYYDMALKMVSDTLGTHRGRLAALEALKDKAGAEKERKVVKQLEADFTPNK